MSEATIKGIVSIAMCLAVAVGCWKTKSANCLWGLVLVVAIWR